jgi:hypothetical protein
MIAIPFIVIIIIQDLRATSHHLSAWKGGGNIGVQNINHEISFKQKLCITFVSHIIPWSYLVAFLLEILLDSETIKSALMECLIRSKDCAVKKDIDGFETVQQSRYRFT